MAQSHITCPNCHTQIDIEEVLARDVEHRLRESFDEQLRSRLEAERKQAAQEERERLEAKLALLQRENSEKSQALKAAREWEIETLELRRKLKESQEDAEAIIRKRVLEAQEQMEQRIRKSEAEHYELREREWQQKLEAVTRQAEELRRKAEQGSQQLAGEVQELAIEEFLRATFPTDEIVEVPKGTSGADCIHHVVSNGRRVGSVLYESKRTKRFDASWIDKFKADVRSQGAEVGVLVSESLPKDVHGFTLIGGVFVCGYQEFKALAYAARELVLRVGSMALAQENRGEKMAMLYQYLTSADFRMNIEAIVEAFQGMKADIVRERASMERLWKQREKQLETVLLSTAGLYGSIKGIAGADVADVATLDLDHTRLLGSERQDAE